MGWYGGWREYVPVAERQQNAKKLAARLAQKGGRSLEPVFVEGRKIAKNFWGEAWCRHLERYSDDANRLPRGATYVRNGSVIDLQIKPGEVHALVSGSDIYTVKITIAKLADAEWRRITRECAASIDSVLDLIQGKFAAGTMRRLTDPEHGLFPRPAQIQLDCSCPDYATMCKHVAATLYGVGARFDRSPELLFTLRNVDPAELIGKAVAASNLDDALRANGDGSLGEQDLGQLFGIELDGAASVASPAAATKEPVRSKFDESPRPATSGRRPRAEGSAKPVTQPAPGKLAAKSSVRSRPQDALPKPTAVKAAKATAPRSAAQETAPKKSNAAKPADAKAAPKKKSKSRKSRVTLETRIVLEPTPAPKQRTPKGKTKPR